jgi:hypothetical protein
MFHAYDDRFSLQCYHFLTFGATLIVSFVMCIIDVFSIPGYVRERNEAILEKISLAASNK